MLLQQLATQATHFAEGVQNGGIVAVPAGDANAGPVLPDHAEQSFGPATTHTDQQRGVARAEPYEAGPSALFIANTKDDQWPSFLEWIRWQGNYDSTDAKLHGDFAAYKEHTALWQADDWEEFVGQSGANAIIDPRQEDCRAKYFAFREGKNLQQG